MLWKTLTKTLQQRLTKTLQRKLTMTLQQKVFNNNNTSQTPLQSPEKNRHKWFLRHSGKRRPKVKQTTTVFLATCSRNLKCSPKCEGRRTRDIEGGWESVAGSVKPPSTGKRTSSSSIRRGTDRLIEKQRTLKPKQYQNLMLCHPQVLLTALCKETKTLKWVKMSSRAHQPKLQPSLMNMQTQSLIRQM